MQHSAQNLERVISLSRLGALVCFSSFLCMYERERETIWRRSVAQQRGDRGLGGRARGDDEVEGGQGCKSLKISQAAEHKAGPQQSSSIPSISAIFVAFSIMSESLPYKLMTKTLFQLRLKKIRRFCHSNFPSCLPTELLSVKSTLDLLSKLSMGLRETWGSNSCV